MAARTEHRISMVTTSVPFAAVVLDGAPERQAIDVHTHVVPETLPPYLGGKVPSLWPSIVPGLACHRHLMIDNSVFRTLSDQCWSARRRVQDMDTMRVGRQVLSPMPELLSYWLAPQDASQLLRYVNEHTAALVHESSGRLLGFAGVPMQSLKAAIDELEYCVRKLGFCGVEIGTNVNGVPIGDLRFDAFFEACVDLDAAVFVHPLKPTAMDRLAGPAELQHALAFPTEVGLAAASVLTTNLLERRPTLRIAFSHGGGTLPSLLPRLERAFLIFPALREAITATPIEQAKRLFYDGLVFDARALQHLVSTVGASQVMVGTDYPFTFSELDPVTAIDQAHFDREVRDKLLCGNASRFLSVKPGTAGSLLEAATSRRPS
jgi:aminocarboxymuconate-semialdehyde decarboxylase